MIEDICIRSQISEKRIGEFANRIAVKNAKIMAIVFVSILVLIAMFMGSKLGFDPLTGRILGTMFVLFSFVTVLVYVAGSANTKNAALALTYEITDEQVSKKLDRSKLSLMNKIGTSNAEMKYGSTPDQSFVISAIASTKINKGEIVIKSKFANLFNENGIIRIPCEISNYEEVKKHIESNSNLFKLIN